MVKDIFSLGELFEEVQLQNIFQDGKTFVDCTPLEELAVIRQRYEEQKNSPEFNLATFVNGYFAIPKTYSTPYVSDTGRPVAEHIELLWDELTRQPEKGDTSLIHLPYPYIVPGGRFREIFYWDSYFTMLGLQVSGRTGMIQNMVDNFSYLIDRFGYIPNGNRTYFLGRSQPPFYASMVELLTEIKGEDILRTYLPQLKKEYHFWMRGSGEVSEKNISVERVTRMPDGSILNRYWDENHTPRPESFKEDIELAKRITDKIGLYRNLRAACESGWDFSSRWCRKEKEIETIHTTDIIPVDLNCLLVHLEQTIAEAYRVDKDNTNFEKYESAAHNRLHAIQKYCWNDKMGFYFDYDFVSGQQKSSLSLAATFPLFFKIATSGQAESVAKNLEKYFLCAGGLQTTALDTGQQWDSPNGWAPLQWIAIKGLSKYGFDDQAKDIALRWIAINEKVYSNTGKMMEKYNVVSTGLTAGGGEYSSQDGFGWTNGIYLALTKMYT